MYVTMAPGPVPDIAALTDATGAFSLPAANRGEYVLEATADNYVSGHATVRVSDQAVRVELTLTRER